MLFYIYVIQLDVWPKIVFYMIVADLIKFCFNSCSHLLCRTICLHLTQTGTLFVLIYKFRLKSA